MAQSQNELPRDATSKEMPNGASKPDDISQRVPQEQITFPLEVAAQKLSRTLTTLYCRSDLYEEVSLGRLALAIEVISIFGERLVYYIDKQDIGRFRNVGSHTELVHVSFAWSTPEAARDLVNDVPAILVNRKVSPRKLLLTEAELERYQAEQLAAQQRARLSKGGAKKQKVLKSNAQEPATKKAGVKKSVSKKQASKKPITRKQAVSKLKVQNKSAGQASSPKKSAQGKSAIKLAKPSAKTSAKVAPKGKAPGKKSSILKVATKARTAAKTKTAVKAKPATKKTRARSKAKS